MVWQNVVGAVLFIAGILLWNMNPIIPLLLLITAIAFLCIGIKKSKDTSRNNADSNCVDDYTPSAPKKSVDKTKYVINPQTMVIHRPTCRYAKNAYSFNTHYTDNLHTALNAGYRCCKYCKPK